VKPPLTPAQALRRRCQGIYAAQRRRAQADGAALNYDADDLVFMAEHQPLCMYCRAPLSLDLVRLDHARPIARGGSYRVDNLRVCCDRCNRLKGQLDADELRALLNFLSDLHPAARQDLERRLLSGAKVYTGSRKARKG
jgi:5-methylcytosine-specific restriction endonuclease McrA